MKQQAIRLTLLSMLTLCFINVAVATNECNSDFKLCDKLCYNPKSFSCLLTDTEKNKLCPNGQKICSEECYDPLESMCLFLIGGGKELKSLSSKSCPDAFVFDRKTNSCVSKEKSLLLQPQLVESSSISLGVHYATLLLLMTMALLI
jgi:hypothetical protein